MKYIRIIDNDRVILEIAVPDDFDVSVSSKPVIISFPKENIEQGGVAGTATPQPLPSPPAEPRVDEDVEAVKAVRKEVEDAEDIIQSVFSEVEKTGKTKTEEENMGEDISEIMSEELGIIDHAVEKAEKAIAERENPDAKEKEEKAKELLNDILGFGVGE